MATLGLCQIESGSSRARELWCGLTPRAQPQYFTSWPFVETWLDALPAAVRPPLYALLRGDQTVALFFLGARRVVRHRLLPSRARYLNTTGDPRYDELTLEHNALLCEPGAELGLREWIELLPGAWDELFLPALSRDGFPGRALDEPLGAGRVVIERRVESPYVDLGRVRAAAGGYLALLGSSTRAQIRRAERGYGEIEVNVAESAAAAREVFAELVELHQRAWNARGQPGAFSDPWFLGFHRELIERRLPHGEIQLMRVRSARATIGCLYNFVWQGRVLFYQSGLASEEDPRKKPGYVCHARAVSFNARAGHDVYDFLGGDARYKQNLATGSTTLIWARVQRPLMRFALEQRLRDLHRALRAH
ncbi:MAG: GNAT family N-acetyltransferase [Polyangiaceae bacterium]|nr:GNAT family N-acetyltransferase [Polyangiaceae bacterium]MCL4752785.1 GNAT family N-acetyltransferase [Myxococcales bacterium]